MSTCVAFLGYPGGPELLMVLFIALMLFGKKLPEVARNMGKGLTEFKKGIRGMEDEVHSATSYQSEPTAERPMPENDLENVTAPKFTPPKFDLDAADPDPDPDDSDNEHSEGDSN